MGVKVEVTGSEEEHVGGLIKLQLHLQDPKKRKEKHKANEAIQFDFHLDNDDPIQVAAEMVSAS
jgi:WNK lysine deficient protein kinase